MRFGGHETFVVREGWLHKGLTLLIQDPSQLSAPVAQDALGVGKNMAKSVRHWLVATGLAEHYDGVTGIGEPAGLRPSALGRLVAERDRHFNLPGTWWMLHVNLVNSPNDAYTWWWFFNHFRRNRFERAVCHEALLRFVEMHERRPPRLRTLQRDVSCLLAMYARTYPPARTDPEDGNESPFVELGLLSHFRESGAFRRTTPSMTSIPVELLGYTLGVSSEPSGDASDFCERSFRECVVMPGGPGSAFGLDAEQIYDFASVAAEALGEADLGVVNLAGDRRIRFRAKPVVEWASQYYQRAINAELAA